MKGPDSDERAVVAFSLRPDPKSVPLFSSEQVQGVELSIKDVEDLCWKYGALYAALTGALAPRWAERLSLPLDAAEVFAHRALVGLSHLFFDRLIRLERLRKRHGQGLFAAEAAPLAAPDDMSQVDNMAAMSPRFNQSVLCFLAPLAGIPVRPWAWEEAPFPSMPAQKGFVNYNYTFSGIIEKMRRKFRRVAAMAAGPFATRWQGCVPTLDMAYDTGPLLARGFFGRGGFVRIDTAGLRETTPKDDLLRREVFLERFASFTPAVRRFLADAGLTGEDLAERVPAALSEFLGVMTPIALLEGARSRIQRARDLLVPYRGQPLVLAEVGHTESLSLIAAARCLGMEVVSHQHGGGEGNLDLLHGTVEIEHSFCGRMITRGWRRFIVPHPEPVPEAVPMPSPFLSERAKLWRVLAAEVLRPDLRRPHDILLMSDKIIPFPRPGMGLEAMCVDHLREQAALLRAMVGEAAKHGIRILHKPYNSQTEFLLNETMSALRAVGGEHYHCLDRLAKGLSPETVRRCRLVLWDKPASGFSECVAAGIPTMVLWPRFSSREPSWARGVFAELEVHGVVHRRPETLCEEFLAFRRSPSDWMRDPARARAVRRFCRRFAWARPDWPRRWRRLVDSFAVGRSAA